MAPFTPLRPYTFTNKTSSLTLGDHIPTIQDTIKNYFYKEDICPTAFPLPTPYTVFTGIVDQTFQLNTAPNNIRTFSTYAVSNCMYAVSYTEVYLEGVNQTADNTHDLATSTFTFSDDPTKIGLGVNNFILRAVVLYKN